MINLLPPPQKNSFKNSFSVAFNRFKNGISFLQSKRGKYAIAAVLDFVLIVFILINVRQPAQRLISPLVSSLNTFYLQTFNKSSKQAFTFVPGLAQNKFDQIDLNGLGYLSFFDIPLTDDGQMNLDSRGYASFTSGAASQLFDRARYNQTKILMTLSSFDSDIIGNVLNNPQTQKDLADQAIEQIKTNNVDGVTIDFEYPNGGGSNYQSQFTNFISGFTQRVHNSLPQATVAVAIPSGLTSNKSLYNEKDLASVSDKVFLIASDFIVPEEKNGKTTNPVYGFSDKDYFQAISNKLGSLFDQMPEEKLVMERAWYGNGDNYPLYVPSTTPVDSGTNIQASDVNLDQATLDNLVAGVPDKAKEAARQNIPLIAQALQKEGILDSNVLAYALATVEHETDGTFQPLEEIQGRISARRLGYEGGENYFGRGFIQLTHLRNYHNVGIRIGMGDQLAQHPELAATPVVAAKILAAFFKDNNVANLASQGDFVAARQPINPDYNGYSVASLAMKYVE